MLSAGWFARLELERRLELGNDDARGNALVVAAGQGFVRVLRWHLSNGVNAPEELEAWLPLTVGKRLS